jgi:ketosteroid isomerase-like protein
VHANGELIKAFYDARARGDRAGVLGMLHTDVAWHDPYPPPHGGDLLGAERVVTEIIEKAGALTGGSTRLWVEQIIATDRHVSAVVGWSSTYRGATMQSRELAVFSIRGGAIAEAWFYPEAPEAALAFFA